MVQNGNPMPAIENSSNASSRTIIDFADMWNMMPLACILVDETLHVTDCNQEALRLWNCSSKEAYFHHYIEFIPDVQPDGANSRQWMRMFLEEAFTAGFASGEFSYRLLSGERLPAELTAVRFSRKGQTCLAVFIQDMRQTLRVEEKHRLLEMLHTIAQELLLADDVFDAALTRALATMGQAVNADRVTLWENFEKQGRQCSRQICQWSKSPPPDQSEDTLTLEYDQVPHWKGRMLAGQVLNGPVADLPAEERMLLVGEKVQSVLFIPLFSSKTFKGFMELDDVHRVRTFSEMEVQALVSGGRLIASAAAHNESAEMLRKARDAALDVTQEKSEFLSRMSHEMRTPLNTIIGLSTIARRTNDLDKLKECFQSMDAACRQLLNIINVVLDIGKIENGKFELSVNEIDLEKVLENAIAVVGVRMEQKCQELHLELEDIFTHRLKNDEFRLTQVVLNLLANASKFTQEHGSVTLRVFDPTPQKDRSRLRFEVEDNGIGIAPEQQGSLFQAFQQADGGKAQRGEGSGLGLAICRQIVDLMGGNIWVRSALDKGSCFSFEIPAQWGEPLNKSKPSVAQLMRVLVVASPDGHGKHLERVLKEFGVEYCLASDASEACRRVQEGLERQKPYNLLLLDWDMANLKSFETAEQFRSLFCDSQVILMTYPWKFSQLEQEARQYGITKCLSKPVLPSILFGAMTELVKPDAGAKREAPNNSYDWSGKHILIVEDIKINREIVVALLEDTGVRMDCVADGQQAVELVCGGYRYDLILMDVQMPKVDGLSATRLIRSHPAGKDVPIIAMTANAFQQDVEECLKAGMNDHLSKPVNLEQLLEKLARYLEKE